jgi:hypothetical protein
MITQSCQSIATSWLCDELVNKSLYIIAQILGLTAEVLAKTSAVSPKLY